jgi:hypothetical protein
MTNTKRPYTGFDKVGGATHPAAKKLSDLLQQRWKMNYMGGLVVRVMRSAPAAIQKLDPHNPKCAPYMSVHSTGRAVDVGHQDPAVLAAVFTYLVANADELHLEEIHQYNYRAPKAAKAWGRGYRCSRADKNNGILEWDAKNNGGTPGGMWIHYEVSPQADPAAIAAHFKANKA